jgi:hypothetical protein
MFLGTCPDRQHTGGAISNPFLDIQPGQRRNKCTRCWGPSLVGLAIHSHYYTDAEIGLLNQRLSFLIVSGSSLLPA